MKDRNKLIIAIIAVLAIIVLVGGATFAYWTWRTDTNQQTVVSFKIENPQAGLYANLEGNGTTEVSALAPAACDNTEHAVMKRVDIKYLNKTVQDATITATLSVSDLNLRSSDYIPTTAQLQNLKYALTTTDDLCTTDVATDLDNNQISGDFSDITFNDEGEHTNLPLKLFDVTFNAPGNMTKEETQTYYLWIYLSSDYEYENIGNTISDPMQELEFTTQWSGEIAQNDPTTTQ